MTSRPVILLIDDNEAFLRQFVPFFAQGTDYEVVALTSAVKALETLDTRSADVIISDMQMPDMNGVEFFRKTQELYSDVPVIFITAFGCMQQAVELVKQGAFQYFEKPLFKKMDSFHASVREALAKRQLLKSLAALQREKSLHFKTPVAIMGKSREIKDVLRAIGEVADVPITVLIVGETGTGKGLVAKAIHEWGARQDKCFYLVNCSEFSEGVLESELFGHEKGAFTGAINRRKGLFEVADQGTLFLDEVSEASPALQAKLLRVIESKTFARVGGSSQVFSDFRLLAATNRNLEEMVAAGRFRQDLLYRLNVYTIAMPPLRDHKEDIPVLAEYYMRRFAQRYRRPIENISMDAMLFLREYEWPGNVRELVNVMERAVIRCNSNLITVEQMPFRSADLSSPKTRNMSLRDAEKLFIEMALNHTKGNKVRASDILGINRKTLRMKMKLHGLPEPEDTSEA